MIAQNELNAKFHIYVSKFAKKHFNMNKKNRKSDKKR